MARKAHVSRLAAPRTWPIKRKGIKWIRKPSQGPHDLQKAMPLLIYLRDILQITKTTKETKQVLSNELVKVNSKVIRKVDFPVGIFDTIQIPATDKYWRVTITKKGKLAVIEIPKSEANLLPVKIVSKKTLNKNKTQLNFSNGWNLLDDKKYKVNDVLILDTEKNSVAKHIKLEKGNLVYVTGGKHTGHSAKLKNIKELGKLKRERIAVLESGKETWQTNLNHVFAIGEDKSEIKIE
ncbi:30S ribosomal protein S4e [Candidatus Woesearchaeota archaeon]|nr:30S ribosomal protein S4e [Candidatus Woesearchaeota archaeon]